MMKEYDEQTVADIVKAQTAEDGSVNVAKVVEKIGQFFRIARSLRRRLEES